MERKIVDTDRDFGTTKDELCRSAAPASKRRTKKRFEAQSVDQLRPQHRVEHVFGRARIDGNSTQIGKCSTNVAIMHVSRVEHRRYGRPLYAEVAHAHRERDDWNDAAAGTRVEKMVTRSSKRRSAQTAAAKRNVGVVRPGSPTRRGDVNRLVAIMPLDTKRARLRHVKSDGYKLEEEIAD